MPWYLLWVLFLIMFGRIASMREKSTESSERILWSRFNNLFRSERFGYFLYNALSNTLLETDEAHFKVLEELRDRGIGSQNFEKSFISLLSENKMLVAAKEEERLLLTRQYDRNALCFDTYRLCLTICPTLLCNFRCPYCFEQSQQNSVVMAHKTIERLLAFIESHKEVHHLALAWYGGEPLIAFNVIREITARIKSLNINFEGAALITNGYLLDKEKCALLNELKIHSVQITLDGPEEIHDGRRFLAGGQATFRRILDNVNTLMNSGYEGSCHIRVNIDRDNSQAFSELGELLLERFKGKKIFIYAGHVDTSLEHSYDHSCVLDLQEWANFTFEAHRRAGLMPTGDFYPASNADGVCVATAQNRFVIGPEGELYKCWEDVGKSAMVVGNIFEADPITNPQLRAQYSIGTDPYRDPGCLACAVLPICGGGCANKRLRAKQFGEQGIEFCSPYKTNLLTILKGTLTHSSVERFASHCSARSRKSQIAGVTV